MQAIDMRGLTRLAAGFVALAAFGCATGSSGVPDRITVPEEWRNAAAVYAEREAVHQFNGAGVPTHYKAYHDYVDYLITEAYATNAYRGDDRSWWQFWK